MKKINNSIWQRLPKPFFVLAPMEEVTDSVFRQVVIKAGAPDLFFTEFVSVEGLTSRGKDKVIHRLEFSKNEKSLIAQIWGLNPEKYKQVAIMIADMGFDGIDINMGCPVDKVIKRGACSGLINNPSLAAEIIAATKEGAGKLPVSVKTRIGFKDIQTESWIGFLLEQKLDALTVHFRTTAELSKVPAHWEQAIIVEKLKSEISPSTIIIGNGDVSSVSQGKELAQKYNLDGIMIGRGIFHNPWIFARNSEDKRTVEEKLTLLLYHLRLYQQIWNSRKNFHILKRFFKIYVTEFEGSSELRTLLMESQSYESVENIVDSFIKEHRITL